MPGVCRWMLSAALAAGAGAGLALWQHQAPPFGQWPPDHGAVATPATSAAAAPANRPATAAGGGPKPATGRAQRGAGEPIDIHEEDPPRSLTEMAGRDPAAALAHLLRLDPQGFRELAEDVVRLSAEHAPHLTLGWLDSSIGDEQVAQWLRAAALAGAAAREPVFAINEIQSLRDSDLRRSARHQVLETWAARDPVAALEWVRGHQGPDGADLHAVIMHAYRRRDPAQASHVIASMPAGSIRNRLVEEHAYAMAESNPAAAAAWVESLDDDQAGAAALESVLDRWAALDPEGLRGWLATRPPQEARDHALRSQRDG